MEKKSKDKNDTVYRIIFHNQGDIVELYAKSVSQSGMYAFIEIAEIIFGERSKIVVDPSDEKLKSGFSGVKRTFIPLHSVIRIDEVEKAGTNKVRQSSAKKDNIQPFPMPVPPGFTNV